MGKVVTVKVMGSEAQVLDGTTASTVQEVINELGLEGKYTVNMNGRSAQLTSTFESGAFIVLSPAVKGA